MSRIGRGIQQQTLLGGGIPSTTTELAAGKVVGTVLIDGLNWCASAFQATRDETLTGTLTVKAISGAPSPLVCSIYADSGTAPGTPTGAPLATVNVPSGTVVAPFNLALTAGTIYWVVYSSPGSSGANHWSLNNPSLTGGVTSTDGGSTWITPSRAPNVTVFVSVGGVEGAQPGVGVRPPLVSPSGLAAPITISFASGLLTNQRRAQQRFPRQWYESSDTQDSLGNAYPLAERGLGPDPPQIVTAVSSAPVVTTPNVNLAAGHLRPARPKASFYTRAPYLSPLAVVTTPGQLVVATHQVRTRPRPTTKFFLPPIVEPYLRASDRRLRISANLVRTRPRATKATLFGFIPTAVGFVAPPIATSLVVPDRIERRHFNSFLNPPIALQTFAGPQISLVKTRPRRFAAKQIVPATLEPESISLAERQIRTVLVRTRPRHTLGTKLGYTVYPATSEITVALIRTRPRPTRRLLGPLIFYPQTTEITVVLARTRPRPTRKTLAAPIFYAQTSEIQATFARIRPRRTTRFLAPPTVLQVFPGPAETEIAVRTPLEDRRRFPHSKLSPPTVVIAAGQIYYGPSVYRTRIRPRHTVAFFVIPATLEPEAVAIAERAIRVALARIRPRPTRKYVAPPSTLEPESVELAERTIRVQLVRTRPRPTTRRLTSVFYPASSEITVALVRTRPRPTRHSLTATSYPQTGFGFLHTARTRPRPTTRFLLPPATLTPYVIELVEETIRVVLTRTRPRPTTKRLVPPTALQVFTGPEVTLVRTRPRPTIERVLPPIVIRVPSVEQREQTIAVTLVETRPRPTSAFIVPPLVKTFPPVVTTPLPAHLVAARPRPTRKFLRPPTVVIPLPTLRMQTVTVALVRTRSRPTRHTLGPLVFYRQTSTIRVSLTRTRPRPKRVVLAPPTVLQVFGPPVEVEIAVRTPIEDHARRRSRSFPIRPVTYPQTSEIVVALVRTRPRPTARFVEPPAVLQTFRAAKVTLVITRPRATHSIVRAPGAVRAFVATPIAVTTVRTRPRPQNVTLEPPTRLRPPETTVRVHLARIRPARVRTVITPPTVVAEPPVVTTPTIKLVATRPRPTTRHLEPPTVIAPPVQPVKVPLSIYLSLQTRIGLLWRRPHFRLGPPSRVHISLHFKADIPTSAWFTDRMTSSWDPDEAETAITTGPPEEGWDADTPSPDWTTGPPA